MLLLAHSSTSAIFRRCEGHGFGTDLDRAEQLLVNIPVKRLPLAGVTCSGSYPQAGVISVLLCLLYQATSAMANLLGRESLDMEPSAQEPNLIEDSFEGLKNLSAEELMIRCRKMIGAS
jgi:hypothetical protein